MAVPHKDVLAAQKVLGHRPVEWVPQSWLDTGITELNEVFGHPVKGIPYGHLIELSGRESQGKTAISLLIAALGQRDGAEVHWADFENSWDPDWAQKRGVDPAKVRLIQNYVGVFGKETHPRLSTTNELVMEIEEGIHRSFSKGMRKIILVVDSVTSMLPEGESDAGLDGGLKQNQALPVFLGKLMRRWVGTAQAYNVLIIFINQMRQNPMQQFGDPWYIPGGNAARFYCHVRAKTKSALGGKITFKGRTIGKQGVLLNFKNKVGGQQDAEVGYKILFSGTTVFCPARDMKEEKEKE